MTEKVNNANPSLKTILLCVICVAIKCKRGGAKAVKV